MLSRGLTLPPQQSSWWGFVIVKSHAGDMWWVVAIMTVRSVLSSVQSCSFTKLNEVLHISSRLPDSGKHLIRERMF